LRRAKTLAGEANTSMISSKRDELFGAAAVVISQFLVG
jgi:hypothetical protein